MKKITLLTAALASAAALAGSSMTANAADTQNFRINAVSYKVIIGGQSQNGLNDLLKQLQNCFPGIIFPDIQGPEQACPSVPETPVPEQPTPEAPDPAQPAPETPNPEQPAPETPAPEQPKPDSTASAYIARVVELVNQERAREGLAPLAVDQSVQTAAQVRAQEIVTSFSHTRPNGSSFSTALKEQNVSYRSAGENIAWGQHSPEEVVNAWMNSAGHRANIMNARFTTIGVGYYQHNGINYWSQLFTS